MSYSVDIQWPTPTGPHPVGYREFEVTDTRRSQLWGPNRHAGRLTHVHVWYPAASMDGHPAIPYLTRQQARLQTAQLTALIAPGVEDLLDHCEDVITASHRDASLLESPDKRPVIVFNHGGLSFARQNQTQMEAFASHGYVVYALERPYESGGVLLLDGSEVPIAPEAMESLGELLTDEDFAASISAKGWAARHAASAGMLKALRKKGPYYPMVISWREDTLHLVDCIEDGEVPNSVAEIAAASDVHSLGYVGMSLGAGLAGMLAQSDIRCKAAWNIDGGYFTGELYDTQIRTPLLILKSDMSYAHEMFELEGSQLHDKVELVSDLCYENHNQAGQRKDVPRIVVPGANHLAMSDLCLVTPDEFKPMLGNQSMVGHRLVEITNRLGIDFFEQYLRGNDTRFPEAQLEAFPELIQQNLAGLRALG